ncbi:solute carrier family 2, facilitated glucose transporter member 10 [Mugil cephalus]|uniref:solute carrier family 2, facilitated glucose transporter member 10 n=1 Tax=Mugil cephalus TaxID=48193 RepID=UPI001FB7B974|nr:solute carrier family 2, facilitated glucose transporter member 10 [Mugil cephalus]
MDMRLLLHPAVDVCYHLGVSLLWGGGVRPDLGCSILLLASVVSSLSGLVFGYELGIISGALLQLRTEFKLSCVQEEALVSSLLTGALLASISSGYFIDHQGRRASILLSNVLVLVGSLIMLISSYVAVVLGRITVGFAMCISSMSCCIFVSEMVTPKCRGFLVTLYEAGITVGILAAYLMNYILSGSKRGWKWMFALAIVPTLLQLVSIWCLPSGTMESFNPSESFQTETDTMSSVETQEADNSKVSSSSKIKKGQYRSLYLFQRKDNMRTRTIIGLGLVLFQQFTGQPNILLYASTIFHSLGFKSEASAMLASVGLGSIKVIATLTSMVFSDKLGRRPLLISGCSIMALCLLTIGLLSDHSQINAVKPCDSQDFSIDRTRLPHSPVGNQSVFDVYPNSKHSPVNNTQDDVTFDKVSQASLEPAAESPQSVHGALANWIILLCMMAVVSAYSIGFGPMTWLLLSEIFPAAVRGRAFAFTNCFNWAANLLVTFTFLNLTEMIGLSGIFLLYGLTSVAAVIFFYFMLPETRGKDLMEIDKELRLDRFYHGEGCCGFGSSRNTFQYERVHCQISTLG